MFKQVVSPQVCRSFATAGNLRALDMSFMQKDSKFSVILRKTCFEIYIYSLTQLLSTKSAKLSLQTALLQKITNKLLLRYPLVHILVHLSQQTFNLLVIRTLKYYSQFLLLNVIRFVCIKVIKCLLKCTSCP